MLHEADGLLGDVSGELIGCCEVGGDENIRRHAYHVLFTTSGRHAQQTVQSTYTGTHQVTFTENSKILVSIITIPTGFQIVSHSWFRTYSLKEQKRKKEGGI